MEQLARVQSQSCSDVSSANEVSESYFSTTELDEIKCVSSATDKLMMDNKTAYDSYSFDTAEESLNGMFIFDNRYAILPIAIADNLSRIFLIICIIIIIALGFRRLVQESVG